MNCMIKGDFQRWFWHWARGTNKHELLFQFKQSCRLIPTLNKDFIIGFPAISLKDFGTLFFRNDFGCLNHILPKTIFLVLIEKPAITPQQALQDDIIDMIVKVEKESHPGSCLLSFSYVTWNPLIPILAGCYKVEKHFIIVYLFIVVYSFFWSGFINWLAYTWKRLRSRFFGKVKFNAADFLYYFSKTVTFYSFKIRKAYF